MGLSELIYKKPNIYKPPSEISAKQNDKNLNWWFLD
jgi:hypothetical protein